MSALALGLFAAVVSAQPAPVPPVMRLAGTVPGAAGLVDVTFALYAEQTGGAPLWTERQAVLFDQAGRYSVVLGQATPDGVRAALFVDGIARWLGVEVDGLPAQPRILLTSVAYALKAADAATIGGKPLSAFVLAGETTGVGADGLTYIDKRVIDKALSGSFAAPTTSGTPGFIGMFTGPSDLGNSVMYQAGTSIGVNTPAPAAAFHVASPAAPAAFFEVYNNLLGQLPAVYRAARGTPYAPAAVQTNDILGGLAVRGYGTTGFGAGVGQVMFRAAQTFTDTAQGTFLQFTTTPLNSNLWVERVRITPEGNVGIGTAVPEHTLEVAGTLAAGPGMTGTPIAHGFFTNTGVKKSGSANIACSWDDVQSRYACTIAGESYYYDAYTAIVTPASGAYMPATDSLGGQLLITFSDVAGTYVRATWGYAVVVYRQ